MILIGIGANLPHPRYGPPRATCGAALAQLAGGGKLAIVGRSHWYRSAPVPVSDQPWFVNAVARVETGLEPAALLALLLATEEAFGRRRGQPNAARTIDLDILAYGRRVSDGTPTLPHPRLAERAFVLLPMADVAPAWQHPATGADVATMIAALPDGAAAERMADADGAFGTEWRPPAGP